MQVREVDVSAIMLAVEQLHDELETNIRNRRISGHRSLSKVRNMSLDQLKSIPSQPASPIRRIKLESIQRNRSVTLLK
jgi:hypothetical protein